MEIIEVYLLLALTTGITSCYLFLSPAVALARELGVQNSFTENTWLSYLIYIAITTITAPFSVLPIFIPSFAERFKIGLERAVMESQT
jgi:uncharacterized membrane protein YdjX (TVP38/TMEM64 family)